MNRYLVPVSVLLILETSFGQVSVAARSAADAGDSVHIAEQNPQMPCMQMPQAGQQEQAASNQSSAYTLDQLQQLAVDHNPTLKQAQAEIRAAEGRKRQAGMYPNPTVGYIGEQISGGPQRGGEQGAFVQQDIVLGGKLGAAKRVVEQ